MSKSTRKLIMSKRTKKTLELEVKCKNKLDVPSDHDCLGCTDASHTGRLCTWTGELRLYKEHLKECDYENVPCENDCGMNMQRWVLADHLRLCCVLRKVDCVHCAIKVLHRQMEAHLTSCPKLPVLCYLECGQSVERENVGYLLFVIHLCICFCLVGLCRLHGMFQS